MRRTTWSPRATRARTRDLVTPAGLRRIATYADGVGANKDLVLPRDAAGATDGPTALVDDAHDAGLIVHVWTLRDENQFMATNFRRGTDPNAKGDILRRGAGVPRRRRRRPLLRPARHHRPGAGGLARGPLSRRAGGLPLDPRESLPFGPQRQGFRAFACSL